VLELGARGALVTLGRRGCLAAWREGDAVRTLELAAPHHPQPPFPTGCGDVFGATFAYAMLSGAAPSDALRLANGVASTKAGLEPFDALRDIRLHAAAHLTACFPS
jgi:sugar/nucleoside kinase (ribokinase family)